MKKSIIAAGAASVALAAMPIVGVFAAGVGSVKDDITATVNSGCTITNTESATDAGFAHNTVTFSVTPGETTTDQASAGISITCNEKWKVSAAGSTTGTTVNSLYYNDGTTNHEITTGTATSGPTSNWAFKIASATATTGDDGTIVSTYQAYAAVPSSATPVVTGAAAAKATIIPNYRVYAAQDLTPGAYVGQVTYTAAIDNGS